jgi:hypothetical protein
MARKSPDKQWNRQNSILFHETIPAQMLLIFYIYNSINTSITLTIQYFIRLCFKKPTKKTEDKKAYPKILFQMLISRFSSLFVSKESEI